MASDPKLIKLMSKIEELCREADVGGHVNLLSKTHGEFRFVLPKWAGLYEEYDSDGNCIIRLKIKKAEGDTHEKAELTAHFLHSVRDVCAQTFGLVDKFIQVTDEKWKTEHTPFYGFEPKKRPPD